MLTRKEGGRIQTVTHAGVRSLTVQSVVLGEPKSSCFYKSHYLVTKSLLVGKSSMKK